MVRRYDEPIEVRTATDPGTVPEGGGAAPVAFIWRERLYVVRTVLTHWYERRVWWREAAASALLGLRSEAVGAASVVAASVEATQAGATAQGAVATARDEQPGSRLEPVEREVWRVEAAAGRASPVGVYDLVRDHGLDAATWRLARLAD
jgi:hypothetical protein